RVAEPTIELLANLLEEEGGSRFSAECSDGECQFVLHIGAASLTDTGEKLRSRGVASGLTAAIDHAWQSYRSALRDRRPTRVMGVVNVTPDSFNPVGRFPDPEAAIDHGLRLAAEGADILDVGGESTRPGAAEVSEEEELRRVLPV